MKEVVANYVNSISVINVKLYTVTIIISLLLIIGVILYIRSIRKLRELQKQANYMEAIINIQQPPRNSEDDFMRLLFIISTIIKAPSYAIYFLDNRSNNYILKAIRQGIDESSQISPSYSGLMPYQKEAFFMPPALIGERIPSDIKLVKEGEVPLIFAPLRSCKGVIVIGPVKNVNKTDLKMLEKATTKLMPMVNQMLERENLKNQVKIVETSEIAVKNVFNIFSEFSGMINMIMALSLKTINAKGGIFITVQDEVYRLESIVGIEAETKELLEKDIKTLKLLSNLVGKEKFISITKNHPDFYKIPPYFVAEGAQILVLLNVFTEKGRAIAVYFYDGNPNVKEYQVAGLKILAKRMGDTINQYMHYKDLSQSYTEILKTLARMIDISRPTTVGYSELMYHYAKIIAKEMKLSPEETRNVALAAYLSNIGIIGLSDQIMLKKGKFTDIEYEVMKLHSDAGASIIEATLGNQQIASYILHHHERVDGYGYPSGLSGEEIPLGSRIIAVVQTFLAKIIGRNYRQALAFEEAIEQLNNSAGTQLDPRVVTALLNWFQRKQQESRQLNRSLAPCWIMRCSTETICAQCPVFQNKNIRCWESRENNCRAHGNDCETCFVRTEYLSRLKNMS